MNAQIRTLKADILAEPLGQNVQETVAHHLAGCPEVLSLRLVFA